jgi:23S rRNA (adenine2503-C2)-methyltransferase
MSDLPALLRERLSVAARIMLPEVSRRYVSTDGSVRYLLSLPGTPDDRAEAKVPARVEAVFMPSDGRQTICISTQAGCAVDCKFCLTAQLGLIRNLSAGEIVGQVLLALEDHRYVLAPRTNVVLMGQGEPLLNFDAVMAAVRLMLDDNGMGIGPRHVTLSTSGIVPGIERLSSEKIRPKLAISLNASNDEQRDAIMPINRKYPLKTLLEACRDYTLGNREYITFEYVLLGGFNDAPEDARRVVRLLSGLRAKVNLIPWNSGAPVKGAPKESELPFRAPDQAVIDEFRRILVDKGQMAMVRYSRGQDIAAACGQLALIESPASISSSPTVSISPALPAPPPA